MTIHIKDVNDMPPVFSQTTYDAERDEELEAPFRLMQVEKIDNLFFYV